MEDNNKNKTGNLPGEESLSDSIETYFHGLSGSLRGFYLFLLVILIAVIALLPLIRIPVFVTSRGILLPVAKSSGVYSPISGKVKASFIDEGKRVNSGDLLVEFYVPEQENEIRRISRNLSLFYNYRHDLQKLLKKNDPDLKTQRFTSVKHEYQNRIEKYDLEIRNARKEWQKLSILLADSLISEKEFEVQQLAMEKLINEKDIFIRGKFLTWNREHDDVCRQIREYETLLESKKEKLHFARLRAPFAGYIETEEGVTSNVYLRQGQKLCSITPDTSLMAEVYVSAADIAWIKQGMEVDLLMDSYDYGFWGTLPSRCSHISSTHTLLENTVCFKVRCKIMNDEGVPGELKTGMTFTARFKVAERSLLQLIKDNLNKTLNPAFERKKLLGTNFSNPATR